MPYNIKFFDERWILQTEANLCAKLANFIQFTSHTLFFPPQADPETILIPEEQRLILPVNWHDNCHFTIMLGGIETDAAASLLPLLPRLVCLCLDSLAYEHSACMDHNTGLATEDNFFARLIAMISGFKNSGSPLKPSNSLALIIFDWLNFSSQPFTLEFYEHIYSQLGLKLRLMQDSKTIGAVCSRLGEKRAFALILPDATTKNCKKIAQEFLKTASGMEFEQQLSGQNLIPVLAAGIVFYPNDLKGRELFLPFADQAWLLLKRARLAAEYASANDGHILEFHTLPSYNGRIIEILAGARLKINLGTRVNIRPGMKFKVISKEKTGITKAETAIVEASEATAIAEIIHLTDANNPPLPGDRLVAMDFGAPFINQDNQASIKSYAEFLEEFNKAKDRHFLMGLCQIEEANDEAYQEFLNGILNPAEEFQNCQPALTGQFGRRTLIFYHPHLTGMQCREFYENIAYIAKNSSLKAFCGLFEYPYINYSKNNAEACVLKALDYAKLLPWPHIGLLDSTAITISADKLASQDETYLAMAEYEKALMADTANALARNSLAVIQAQLGKSEDALRNFKLALKNAQNEELKAKICYNLGALHEKLGNIQKAIKAYEQCVSLDASHGYALLKLGSLREKTGESEKASELYQLAAGLGDQRQIASIAQRRQARLLAGKDMEAAREILHELLRKDPADHGSLLLLAKLYLDSDPHMTEILIKKAINIEPDFSSWIILEQALIRQNRIAEAAEARIIANLLPTNNN